MSEAGTETAAAPKKLEKLTPEQEAMLPQIRDEWLAIGLATGPVDRARIERAVKVIYERGGYTVPPIVWCDSPYEGAKLAAQMAKPECTGPDFRCEVSKKEISDQVWQACYGQHDASWLAFYDAMRRFGLVEETAPFEGGLWEMGHCGWWWPFDGVCICTERSLELHRDGQERGFTLHREDGPAMVWPDGFGVYSWHGVLVPKLVIETPDQITVEMIDGETNAEVRRIMLERFGLLKYFEAKNAELVDESLDLHRKPRRLLRLPRDGEDPIMAIQLVNSTPEVDGTFKTYVLRVAPDLRPIRAGRPDGNPQELTALNAVASTFGMTGAEYTLAFES